MQNWRLAMNCLEAELYIATLVTATGVIPAKAGIGEDTGFRVKPGMTERKTLMSLSIAMNIGRKELSSLPQTLNEPSSHNPSSIDP